MIFEQTCELLVNKYRAGTENLSVDKVVIGLNLTAVRLSDSSVGVASNIPDNHSFCAKHNRDFGDFTPLKIIGQKVPDILFARKDSGMIASLRTAVINAVSSKIAVSGNYRIVDDCDPVQLIDPDPEKTIAVVGAFQSYIQKFAGAGNKLFVVEMNENALADEHKKFFVQADRYSEILPQSDIVIITGQTLVNSTLDDLLSVVSPGAQVIVTGPSAGILPEVLFGNRVNIIGSMKITDSEMLFDVVSQGGKGFHLFEYCARKICILNGDDTQVK